jgi:hypothetical protein
MRKTIPVLLIIIVFIAIICSAGIHADEVKIIASNGQEKDYFGYSVDILGDYAIVGGCGNDSDKGAAYVFKRDGSSWKEHKMLFAKDGTKEDWFGYSVAMSEDYVIVGAPWDDSVDTDSGSVYFFRRNGDSWTEEAKFAPHHPLIRWCNLGYSVDISDDYAIVGSRQEDHQSGAAYIYHYEGNSWQEQQVKFRAKDTAHEDQFGYCVSISGDHAIIGAWGDDDKGNNAGCAYIFRRDNASWVEQVKLTADDGAANDLYGTSVDISGNYAIVGSYMDGDKGSQSGSAYIYHYDGTSWTEQAKLTADDGKAGAWFGVRVYISQDYAIVGATKESGDGAIYVFTREGTSWNQVRKQKASDGLPGDMFGRSIAISGDYAIIGADESDNKAFDSGSAYIYRRTDLLLPDLSVEPSGAATTTFGGEKNGDIIAEAMADLSTEAVNSVPREFCLLQNYPNPFNPETWIPYHLQEASPVVIRIHNSVGQLARTLDIGYRDAGIYVSRSRAAYWDGRNESGEAVASGIYFYSITAGDYTAIRKMTVTK